MGVDSFCIGLTDEVQENNWKLVSGEFLNYQNWNSGEPNNGSQGNYAYMFSFGNSNGIIPGKWDDYDGSGSRHGIIERIPPPLTSASITKLNENVLLKVETQPGKLYSLESSTNLNSWENMFIFPSLNNTNVTKIYLPAQVEDKKFYRVR